MALHQTLITPTLLAKPSDKTTEAAAYASMLERATHLAGVTSTRVSIGSLGHFVRHHIDSPLVDRALNSNRFYSALLGDDGGALVRPRVTRDHSGRSLAIAVDSRAAALARTDLVNVVLLARVPSRVERYDYDARCALVPQALDYAYGRAASSIACSPTIGTVDKKQVRFGSRISKAAEKANASRSIRDEKKGGGKAKKQQSRSDEAMEVDDDDIDDGGDEEPEGGIDLMDDDEDDEDDDDEEEDGEFDDFLASDDDVNDSDGEDDSSSSSSDDEEPNQPRRKRRGRKIIKLQHDSDSDDDFSQPNVSEQPMSLEQVNQVPRFDGRIFLHENGPVTLGDGTTIEADHTYVVDGKIGYESTTTVMGQFKDPFDAMAASRAKVNKKAWHEDELYGPSNEWALEELRRRWKDTSFAGDTQAWSDEQRRVAEMFTEGRIGFETLEGELRGKSPSIDALLSSLASQRTDLCCQYVRDAWTRASTEGTAMHEALEFYFDTGHPEMTRRVLEQRAAAGEIELGQFLRWHDTWLAARDDLEPFRVELRIASAPLNMTGSIDMLFRRRSDPQRLVMVDWKRSKGVSLTGYNRVPLDETDSSGMMFQWQPSKYGRGRFAKRCYEPFDSIDQCKFNSYRMQQMTYKMIIERETDYRVDEMYLLVCHPLQGHRYDLMPIEYDEAMMEAFYEWRARQVEQSRVSE